MTDASPPHGDRRPESEGAAEYEASFLERAYRALLAHDDFGQQLRDLAEAARAHTACEGVMIARVDSVDASVVPVEALQGPWVAWDTDAPEPNVQESLQMPVITDGIAGHVMTFYKGTSPGRFSPVELDHARRLAELAGLILAGAERSETVGRLMHDDDGPAVASRNEFEDEVAAAIASHDGQAGFLVVRISDLNEVNQRHGREVGDEVLRLVARSLREAVGSSGTVGRVRRHEFAAVLPGETYARASELAAALDKTFENPLPVLGRDDVFATIVIGVAAATGGDSGSVVPLFHAAYTALERGLGKDRRRGSRWLIP